jgi:Zn-dependent protease with chaperone function
MVDLLTPDERRAVLEHELAHVRTRDDRYLPYFHVLASVVFFDPLLRFLRDRLTRRYEFEADETAARRTRRPRALASALLKFYEASPDRRPAVAFAGHRLSLIVERIERLLALAREIESSDLAALA